MSYAIPPDPLAEKEFLGLSLVLIAAILAAVL